RSASASISPCSMRCVQETRARPRSCAGSTCKAPRPICGATRSTCSEALSMTAARSDRESTEAAAANGPLSGFRVLEMGSTVAGPFCGRLLADFGAEVIKVEPSTGDPVRSMGKRFHGKSLYATSIFRNKALISIDLHAPEGRMLAADLARQSDVVVENFRPGGLEKWGLGYEQLSAANPRL